MAMRWFRVYASLLHNPKFQRLADVLKARLLNIWCVAADNDGALPPHEDLAFQLRLSTDETREILGRLVSEGFIDETERGLQPHDWNEHQCVSDISTGRVKKHREEKKRKAAVPVTGVKRLGPVSVTAQSRDREERGESTAVPVSPLDTVTVRIDEDERRAYTRVEVVDLLKSGAQYLDWPFPEHYADMSLDELGGLLEMVNQAITGYGHQPEGANPAQEKAA